MSFFEDETSLPFEPFAHLCFSCAAHINLRIMVSGEVYGHLSVLESFRAGDLLERYDVFAVYAHETPRVELCRDVVKGGLHGIRCAVLELDIRGLLLRDDIPDVCREYDFLALCGLDEETLAVCVFARDVSSLPAPAWHEEIARLAYGSRQFLLADGFEEIRQTVVAESLQRVFLMCRGEDYRCGLRRIVKGIEAEAVLELDVGDDDVYAVVAVLQEALRLLHRGDGTDDLRLRFCLLEQVSQETVVVHFIFYDKYLHGHS